MPLSKEQGFEKASFDKDGRRSSIAMLSFLC